MASAARILDFQNVLSWASSGVIRSACKSLRTQSIHLPLGLPLGLFLGTLMSTTALTSLFSSILCMCPYTGLLENLFLLLSNCPTFQSANQAISSASPPLYLLLLPDQQVTWQPASELMTSSTTTGMGLALKTLMGNISSAMRGSHYC